MHEVAVVTTLREALELGGPLHETFAGHMLASDKKLVGALDSACNRTVCGKPWFEHYMKALRDDPCWQAVAPYLKSESERETFKFGNDGTKVSFQREKLPMMVGGTLVFVWTSVVEVKTLGLLLGRDFLEAIGGVISFTRRALRADHLDGKRIPLRQLVAGHFYLNI